jgi:hypothetical protein
MSANAASAIESAIPKWLERNSIFLLGREMRLKNEFAKSGQKLLQVYPYLYQLMNYQRAEACPLTAVLAARAPIGTSTSTKQTANGSFTSIDRNSSALSISTSNSPSFEQIVCEHPVTTPEELLVRSPIPAYPAISLLQFCKPMLRQVQALLYCVRHRKATTLEFPNNDAEPLWWKQYPAVENGASDSRCAAFHGMVIRNCCWACSSILRAGILQLTGGVALNLRCFNEGLGSYPQ